MRFVVSMILAAAIAQPAASYIPVLERVQEIRNAEAAAQGAPVVSPDGAYAYVGGASGAVHVFAITSNAISAVQSVHDGTSERLERAVLAMSPDGASLYAASPAGAIAAFSRDTATGRLSWVATYRNSRIDFLASLSDIAVTPDGTQVYVTAAFDSALALFDRNAVTSELRFVATWREDAGGIQGLDAVSSLALSPDGTHLYSLGHDFQYFPTTCVATLLVFARDANTGLLDLVQTDTDPTCSHIFGGFDGDLVVSPDGAHLYAARVSDGLVTTLIEWSRDAVTGSVTRLDSFRRDGVNGLAMAPDGSRLYTSSALCNPDCDGAFVAWLRDAESGALSLGGETLHAIDETSAGVSAHPDGARVVIAGYSRPDLAAVIAQAEYLEGVGYYDVTSVGVPLPDRMEAPRAIASTPDGRHAYVGSGDTILGFEHDTEDSPFLTFIDAWPASPPSSDLDDVRGLAMSPDGVQLYATGLASNSVAVFTRDPNSGSLTFLQALHDGSGGVDGLYGARGITVTADGKHVYVASISAGAVALFSRAPLTGELSFVTAYHDGVDGMDGLAGATAIALSPDGAHLYVASQVDDAVAVFARDAETGALTFVEDQRDGVDGVNGLDVAVDVAVSADGASVYVVGLVDNGLAGFQRDDSTGALSFQHFVGAGRATRSVEIAADGTRVFAASQYDGGVVVLDRDPATGILSFHEFSCFFNAPCEAGSFATAVRPDGSLLYLVSLAGESLTTFAIPEPDATIAGIAALLAVASLRSRRSHS